MTEKPPTNPADSADDAPQPPAEAAPAAAPAESAAAPTEPLEAPPEAPTTAAVPTAAAAAPPKGGGYIWGTGRRKSSVARVRIRPGTGAFLINKRQIEEYFKSERNCQTVRSPLAAAEVTGRYDVWANVNGGGTTGQADAVMLGLARALTKAIPEAGIALREKGLLTRDAREVERKKYGQKGARKRFQFSKR